MRMQQRIAVWAGLLMVLVQVGCGAIGNTTGEDVTTGVRFVTEASPDEVDAVVEALIQREARGFARHEVGHFSAILGRQIIGGQVVPYETGSLVALVSIYPERARFRYQPIPYELVDLLRPEIARLSQPRMAELPTWRDESCEWDDSLEGLLGNRLLRERGFDLERGMLPPLPRHGMLDFFAGGQYPEAAINAEAEGQVWSAFVIDTNGTPTCITLYRSLPFGLTEETVRYIQAFDFEPGLMDGKPVPVRMRLPITYRLN